MTEIDRIRDQLRRAVEGDAWHGPAFLEAVHAFDAERAARRYGNAHTAWEVTAHIAVWLEVAAARVRGEASEPTQAEDWPVSETESAAAWAATVTRVERAHDALQRAIAKLGDDARLEDTVPNRPHTIYQTVHGAIQHTLYHAGQLAMLTKLEAIPARTR